MLSTIPNRIPLSLLGCLLVFVLSSCAALKTPSERFLNAIILANQHGWQSEQITTQQFELMSFRSVNEQRIEKLTIYIEGDGLAWLTRSSISLDPTPMIPVGLKLALQHPTPAVYLARPCQYTGGVNGLNCNITLWTSARFSTEVIEAMNEAVDKLKKHYHARDIELVGFSGGGAIAALLAAIRVDVVRLITIAGNLDHKAWTTHHNITHLTGSLNPTDYYQQLAHIEQIHFIGEKDNIVPAFITQQFVEQLPASNKINVVVVPEQSHHCCWAENWTTLLKKFAN